MTSSYALKLVQDTDRFSLSDTRLGMGVDDTLKIAQRHFGQEARCTSEKGGVPTQKKATLLQVCVFDAPANVFLARHKVLKAGYQFRDGLLQQIDLEMEPKDEGQALDALEAEISASLGIPKQQQGPMKSWVGESDAAMLVRQGNLKLRVLNRSLLPADADYERITPRAR